MIAESQERMSETCDHLLIVHDIETGLGLG